MLINSIEFAPPPEMVIANVFNYQESESTRGTSGEMGSGLGLSIVKSFVDSYGGKLKIVNPGKGTQINITLDRAP